MYILDGSKYGDGEGSFGRREGAAGENPKAKKWKKPQRRRRDRGTGRREIGVREEPGPGRRVASPGCLGA